MNVKPRLTAFVLLLCIFSACKKDPVRPAAIDLSVARMTDFQLVETAYTDITVTHPVIANGAEIQPGTIEVFVPQGTPLNLTPKTSNFSKEGFSVSPQLGVQQNFQNRVVIYTIASTRDASKQVHYRVEIKEEPAVPDEEAAVTDFLFLKANNPQLPSDVESVRIIDGVGTMGKIFVFVPQGTDYSTLKPTIQYTGAEIYYSQDPNAPPANSTTTYPAGGLAIDFSYPKVFYVIVKSGADVKMYDVIVDVRDPIRFDNPSITVPDVARGASQFLEIGSFLNVGNHPVSLKAITNGDHFPAGITAVRGAATVPNGGVLPNQRGKLQANISAQTFPAGNYEVTTTLVPRLFEMMETDDLLQPASVRIKVGIVE